MNVRDKIIEILKEVIPNIDVSSNDLMSESGVDSLSIIHLISEIDLAFNIEITFNDIANEQFNSVDNIEKTVLKYLNNK